MKASLVRILSSVLICAALCAGAVIIGSMDQKNAAPVFSDAAQEDAIARFRTDREQLRAMHKAQLNDIIHDASTDADTADMARRKLIDLCTSEEQELTIEGILTMRGFSDPVVTVHNGSVNVLIEAETITKQESSVIMDLVSRECSAMAGDIKIIPIN